MRQFHAYDYRQKTLVANETEHADHNYLFLNNAGKAILSLTSLKSLEEKLPPKRFLRVHRSFIVSLDKITSMTKNSVQVGKKLITIGEHYKDAFAQFVGKWI